MKKTNIKIPIVFRVGMLLLCAFLLSSHMMGGLYARYSTQATASDSIFVAEFSFKDDLSEQSLSIPISLKPGESIPTTINITNDGDVTIRYVAKIENLTDNLPIEDQTFTSEEIVSGATRSFDLEIEWPKNDSSIEYMGKIDVLRVVVSAEQVD